MKMRPTSVTVISWILISSGGISLITNMLILNDPVAKELMARNLLPVPVQYAMRYAGMLVMIVSGLALLKGRNWARLLYVIWSAVGFLIGVATSPIMKMAMFPGFVFYLVVVFFLFRPKVNQYFSASEVESVTENP